jgi:hypothetical protein
MKITNVDNLSKYLYGSIPIGKGTTAISFLMPNGKVLKIYYKNELKTSIISKREIFDKINNDSYIVPEELLIKDNKCIAQIYRYVKANTLHNIKSNFKVSDILKAYKKLIIDTKHISDNLFTLIDLHDKNILFDNSFYVIDLDRGFISDSLNKNQVFNLNMRKINEVILNSLFKVKDDYIIEFKDSDTQNLYANSMRRYDEFELLLEKFLTDTSDSSIKKLSKSIKHTKEINTYYKSNRY